jgi:hypothetical protein
MGGDGGNLLAARWGGARRGGESKQWRLAAVPHGCVGEGVRAAEVDGELHRRPWIGRRYSVVLLFSFACLVLAPPLLGIAAALSSSSSPLLLLCFSCFLLSFFLLSELSSGSRIVAEALDWE